MNEEKAVEEIKNSVTIEQAGACRKKVLIEIPEEKIKKMVDEQYESLRKEVIVPGFRKGRAPRRLLEKRFGKETGEQIKLKLIAQASDTALKDNKIDYLRDPDIDVEKITLPESGPMKFDFEVKVKPEFELPGLEGIEVKKTKIAITDEQIGREIEMLMKWSGMWTPREDGAIQLDDQVIADVVIKTEGVEEEQKYDNTEIYVRANGFVAAVPVEKLDELLVGAKAGQEKKITVQVPQTYFREEIRGKTADITISIKDVKWLKPAELNETFLSRFAVKDKAELEKKVADNLANRAEQTARQEMAEQIYKYLLDKTTLELPVEIVAEQSVTILQRQYLNLLRQGLSKEQIEQQTEQLKAASDQQAKEQLKTFFIMDKVAEKFDIKTTDEEINGYIHHLAMQRGQRPERLKETMARDGSLAQLAIQVREDKCIEKILQTAKVTEVEPPKETPEKKEKKIAKKTEKAAAPKTQKSEEKEAKPKKKPESPAKKKSKE
jgi:trigger factor